MTRSNAKSKSREGHETPHSPRLCDHLFAGGALLGSAAWVDIRSAQAALRMTPELTRKLLKAPLLHDGVRPRIQNRDRASFDALGLSTSHGEVVLANQP